MRRENQSRSSLPAQRAWPWRPLSKPWRLEFGPEDEDWPPTDRRGSAEAMASLAHRQIVPAQASLSQNFHRLTP
jgi:hypothetical protein